MSCLRLFCPLGYWRPLGIPRKHLPPKQGRKDCKRSVPFHWSLDYTFHHLAFNCWHKHSTNDLTHYPLPHKHKTSSTLTMCTNSLTINTISISVYSLYISHVSVYQTHISKFHLICRCSHAVYTYVQGTGVPGRWLLVALLLGCVTQGRTVRSFNYGQLTV